MRKLRIFIAVVVLVFVIDVSLIMIFINGTESWKFQTTDNSTYEIVKSKFSVSENTDDSIAENENTESVDLTSTDVDKKVTIVIEHLEVHLSNDDMDKLTQQ